MLLIGGMSWCSTWLLLYSMSLNRVELSSKTKFSKEGESGGKKPSLQHLSKTEQVDR